MHLCVLNLDHATLYKISVPNWSCSLRWFRETIFWNELQNIQYTQANNPYTVYIINAGGQSNETVTVCLSILGCAAYPISIMQLTRFANFSLLGL